MAVQSRKADPNAHQLAWCRALFEANMLAMLVYDPASRRVLDVNPALAALAGRAAHALRALRVDKLFAPSGARADPGTPQLRCMVTSGGTRRRVLQQSCPLRHGDQDAVLVVLQAVDEPIERHIPAPSRSQAERDDMHRAQALAHIGNWSWDAGGGARLAASPEGFRILGFHPDHAPGAAEVLARIHIDDHGAVLEARKRALAQPGHDLDVQFRVVLPEGDLRWVHAVAEVRRDAAGRPLRMAGLVQDITVRRSREDKMRRLAYSDTLTGLPNRNMFERHCAARLSQLAADERLACLIVDLARLRDVNYALTHLYGDILLALVADRLAALVGDAGMLARVDAHFTILFDDADEAQARRWALRIHDVLEAPFSVAGVACAIGARIGIALAPSQGRDYHTLLRKADIALYQAAQAGREMAVYDAGGDPHTPNRLSLVGDFRAAIESGQLRLFCQPKVDIRSREIVGAEALVRWWHPEKGCIAPDSFVPLIESTELIHLLTQHMLEGAVAQCEAWRSQGVMMPIAVNLSARDVGVLALSEHLRGLLDQHGSRAGMIGLEVTETSLMRNPAAGIAELQRLSAMGFKLYVDDFGTGYSSLNYLSRLPVDVIKIDHGFTMKMIEDQRAAAIVKSTIHLAHDLGMAVVAEGVSERRIWDALQALGCDEAQGYFIAPPLPADQLLEWARASPYALRSSSGAWRGERVTA